jgi:transcriptional regulator with XRE-family HTH domain
MNIPVITLGMRLAIARKMAGVSAKDIASKLRVTETTISRYENDRSPVPESVLYAYQAICDTPIEWLRGELELTQATSFSRWETQMALFAPYRAA